jgi:hypothetical protein
MALVGQPINYMPRGLEGINDERWLMFMAQGQHFESLCLRVVFDLVVIWYRVFIYYGLLIIWCGPWVFTITGTL